MAGYTHGAAPSAGLRLWMWARLGMGVSQLIGWASPVLGLPLIVGLEGLVWILAMSLEMAAYCVFFGFARWGRVLLPITLLSSAIVLAGAVRGANHVQLSALVGVVVAFFAAAMAWALLRRRSASLLQRIIGINDALFATAVAVWVISGWLDKGPLDHGIAQQVAYLTGYLLMIVNGFGFLLLCKQKDDQRMVKLASTDCLTGLPNRHAFLEQADSARVQAQRQRSGLGLLMIDIDHFKQINDSRGHEAGDRALQFFAAVLKNACRSGDIVCRYGGEEFCVLLLRADEEAVLAFDRRIRIHLQDAAMPELGHALGYSGGMALRAPDEVRMAGILRRADAALYRAKAMGRARTIDAGRVAAELS